MGGILALFPATSVYAFPRTLDEILIFFICRPHHDMCSIYHYLSPTQSNLEVLTSISTSLMNVYLAYFANMNLGMGEDPVIQQHRVIKLFASIVLYIRILFHLTLDWLRRSSKVQECEKRKHRSKCAVFSATSPHTHVVSPLK